MRLGPAVFKALEWLSGTFRRLSSNLLSYHTSEPADFLSPQPWVHTCSFQFPECLAFMYSSSSVPFLCTELPAPSVPSPLESGSLTLGSCPSSLSLLSGFCSASPQCLVFPLMCLSLGSEVISAPVWYSVWLTPCLALQPASMLTNIVGEGEKDRWMDLGRSPPA